MPYLYGSIAFSTITSQSKQTEDGLMYNGHIMCRPDSSLGVQAHICLAPPPPISLVRATYSPACCATALCVHLAQRQALPNTCLRLMPRWRLIRTPATPAAGKRAAAQHAATGHRAAGAVARPLLTSLMCSAQSVAAESYHRNVPVVAEQLTRRAG